MTPNSQQRNADRKDILFYPVVRLGLGNKLERDVFGVGADRSLWTAVRASQISRERLKALCQQHGENILSLGPGNCLYIDVRALVLDCKCPFAQEAMVTAVRVLVDKLRPPKLSHESASNN